MNELKIKNGVHKYNLLLEGKQIHFVLDNKPGARSLVVLLHGLGCTGDAFRHILQEPYRDYFSDSSLLLLDFVGFGKSGKPEDFCYTMEEQARLCELLLNKFPGMDLFIVGHSMGGGIALLFSEALFKRVKGFANLEGNLLAADCGVFSKEVVKVSIERYRAKHFKRQKKLMAKWKMLKFDETTPDALYLSAQSLVEWSESSKFLDMFMELKVKKTYFYGEENQGMPLLKKLAPIESIMIPNAGHGMMTDNPGDFYLRLSEFIGDIKQGSQ